MTPLLGLCRMQDRKLVQKVFGIKDLDQFLDFDEMTYGRYSTFCVRAVLVKILEINWTTWLIGPINELV